METVTLQGKDFSVLHNTLWELDNIDNPRVKALVERIRTVALKDAYEQDNEAFDRKMDYYSAFKDDNGLRSIWSIFELPVHGFASSHPYPSDSFVVYNDHWGHMKGKHYPVQGTTWGDVYRAADLAIRESGDEHHIFIELFTLKNGNELHMITGS
jgi:hypothetical protein